MLKVLTCIAVGHDTVLLGTAAVICALACVTSFNLAQRAREKTGRSRLAWLVLAAVATGYGIWATHFIAMIGYTVAVPTGYDVPLTVASALIAIGATGIALSVAFSPRHAPWRLWVAGSITGVGVAAMHYTGMAAWQVAAEKSWNVDYAIASVALGIVLAGAAFHVGLLRRNLKPRLLGAVILVVAIVAMHFTAMTALTLTPNATIVIPSSAIAPEWLGGMLAIITVTLLSASLVGAALDEHMDGRAARENERLQGLLEAIRKSETRAKRLALVAETSSDAITIMDQSTERIIWANEVFAAAIPAKAGDLPGKTFDDLAVEMLAVSPSLDEINAAIGRGERIAMHVRTKTPAGTKDWEGMVRLVVDKDTGVRQRIANFHDVTRRLRAEQRLRDSEERLQLAYRGSNDGIWDWHVQDDALMFSSRGHELLGLGDDDPRLASMAQLAALIHPEDAKRALAAVQAHLHERTPYGLEYRLRLKSGSYRWFRTRAQAVWNDDGVAVRMAGSLSDIDDLVRTRKEAELANKLKSQFLANMSHEIRTPMNGVMGMAQLLMKTSLDDKQERFCSMLVTSSKALLAIINDILDLSKIEAGLMTLNLDKVEMREMIEEALGRVEGVAAQKGLKLRHAIAPARFGTFEADAPRIIQVLVNLLGNAIKFTDVGEVLLDVSESGNGTTRFSVRDSGEGIPQEQLAVVFERFRQVDGSSTRKHGGTGLGLAITKELVHLMRGELGLDSTVGVGSTFWFEIPLDISQKRMRQAQAPDTEAAGSALHGLRVLVAEDNATNQEVAREMLDLLGAKPEIVGTGRAAIDALERAAFDLVLMDIHMPEMNGDTAIQNIRTCGKPYAHVPIIVVTASAMKGMEERYIDLGADGYVPKPIDLPLLSETVRKIFNKNRMDAA
jgi:PAS domain S-box-containing protein